MSVISWRTETHPASWSALRPIICPNHNLTMVGTSIKKGSPVAARLGRGGRLKARNDSHTLLVLLTGTVITYGIEVTLLRFTSTTGGYLTESVYTGYAP